MTFVASAAILVLLLLGVFAIARARRIRGINPAPLMSIDEFEFARRAAAGDETAAQELIRRADAETAALRRRAETDRQAALEYRDRIRQQLRTLEPLHTQLAGTDLGGPQRREIAQRIAAQQTDALRELDWVEGRLERRRR